MNRVAHGDQSVTKAERPLTILHVEDNSDHARLTARGLGKSLVANVIHHVTDGEQALNYLLLQGRYQDAESAPRPDIVLLDLRLPKIDGLEVLKRLKTDEVLKKVPVVVLTSSEAEKDVAQAYEYHANSYLVKPVGFEGYSELMQQFGLYWLASNRYAGRPHSKTPS